MASNYAAVNVSSIGSVDKVVGSSFGRGRRLSSQQAGASSSGDSNTVDYLNRRVNCH